MPIDELRILDAIVVRASLDLVSQITPSDLEKPTPCTAWTLHGLLAHMATQHYGFAASADGESHLDYWRLVPLGEDPIATYRDSVKRVLNAFVPHDLDARKFALPEFSTEITFTAEQALGFHFVDYLVHSWDVAKTLGLPIEFQQEVLDAGLKFAESIPNGQNRKAPGAAFGPAVDGSGPSDLDTIVALLGRSPSWPDVTPRN
ncbi:TIGR03086 family metal-binding protein [Amycolatopsis sp. BJA-103]|uniref:TIGR03086 family metal-binding protein n=1 Tax=unclassified Amycolatopsis TaxID=2618356 RepID=UPI000C755B17|nr:TIGR03086 family metal-binding protein [Amycolatopsis sp. BJA-103]AUI59448.1 TIGR03086 family protein [Amycolatopsis sp. BJA-103]PNE17111.1 TIGR03086 family protein [Amycolatopsis sp. BJA-103]